MRAVNHVFERYKVELLRCVTSHYFILNSDMYRNQKERYGVTKSQVDKAINQLVADDKIVVKGDSGFLIVALADASGEIL